MLPDRGAVEVAQIDHIAAVVDFARQKDVAVSGFYARSGDLHLIAGYVVGLQKIHEILRREINLDGSGLRFHRQVNAFAGLYAGPLAARAGIIARASADTLSITF